MIEVWRRKTSLIAVLALAGIAVHLLFRFGLHTSLTVQHIPLWMILGLGGIPLLYDLLKRLLRRQFGSDLLAGISIVLGLFREYLAGSIVVLMLAGGEALETYA